MAETIFEVIVHRDDYTAPAVGDREVDEELGPIVVSQIFPEGDQWRLTYEINGGLGASVPQR